MRCAMLAAGLALPVTQAGRSACRFDSGQCTIANHGGPVMAGGECTRAILCFVLAAVVSTRPTAARGDVPAGPSVPPAATLRVDTDPADAHVYVRDASSDRSRICIGHCTLLLPPGTWHLDAGFSHRHLQRAPAPVILAA